MHSFLQKLIEFFRRPTKAKTTGLQLEEIESLLRVSEEQCRRIETLVRIVEERSRTLEYMAGRSVYAQHHQTDVLLKFYLESAPKFLELSTNDAFNAKNQIQLKTDFPLALGSYDHLNPDSTTEGLSRPTMFVRDCISVLGENIKSLDLGTGAAGLAFEFSINGIVGVGIDGSDFCRTHRIGYWPVLSNNLFTCDITKPFHFLASGSDAQVTFEIITMWEVLEHIAEHDLQQVFKNISRHLDEKGYFVGSISMLDYRDGSGIPYHVTLQSREWWRVKFLDAGLVMLDSHPFNEALFCRGNGPRFQDFHNYSLNPDEGFHFVARKIFSRDFS